MPSTFGRLDPLAARVRVSAPGLLLTDLARLASARPLATLALTSLIVLVTLVEFSSGTIGHSIAAAALVAPAVRAREWWRLLTPSYMHANRMHLAANAGGLLLLGHFIETYDRRMRVPLVYLASAVAGNIASTFFTSAPVMGASGGVLGLAGYLLLLCGGIPNGAPEWIGQGLWRLIGPVAVTGSIMVILIDNPAHAGGLATGAAIGAFAAGWAAHSDRRARMLDSLGWAATLILLAGALLTVTQLLR